MEIHDLVRENIKRLIPYTSARSLFNGDDAVLLDANENGAELFGKNLNRYPDPLQKELKNKISRIKNIAEENIFLGNGSDEAIDLLFRIFCEPGKDEIIICPPTYGMYKVQAHIHNTLIKEVLLDDDFDLRPAAILDAVTENTKMLFLCSPNNPTGNLLDEPKIKYLIQQFPGIVVVDEAYIDYSRAKSWGYCLSDFKNLIVLQTFSKAWALAGIRIGMAYASKEIIHYFNCVKFPYNINLLTQQSLLNYLDKSHLVAAQFNINTNEKNRVVLELMKMNFVKRVYPSDANFLLVKMENCDSIFASLKANHIIVRDRSNEPLCEGCLRVTIGAKSENDLLINTLKKINKSG